MCLVFQRPWWRNDSLSEEEDLEDMDVIGEVIHAAVVRIAGVATNIDLGLVFAEK